MWAKFSKLSPRGSGHQTMAQRQLTKKNTSSTSIVDQEYIEALHTKSFVDIYSRMQDQRNLMRSSTTIQTPRLTYEQVEKKRLQKTQSSPLSSHYYDNGIPDFFFEPGLESLLTAPSVNSGLGGLPGHLDKLLIEFFDATHQSSTACASILTSIDGARSHHRSIHRLFDSLSSKSSPSILSEISSHLDDDNAFSPENLSHFHDIHARYPALIQHLTCTNRKITRRLNLIKFTKKASVVALLALLGAVVAAGVVIASHGAAAIAAAPLSVAVTSTGLGRRRRRIRGWVRMEKVKAPVDAAAKGAYAVGRDLDTMSQILRRLRDEVEHDRDIVRMVLMNREWEMVMREVLREMEGRRREVGLGFEEQLEELEEHVYLCLITINRSRRLVAQEMRGMLEAAAVA